MYDMTARDRMAAYPRKPAKAKLKAKAKKLGITLHALVNAILEAEAEKKS